MVLQAIIGAVSAGALIALIAWGVSCARCTELREMPENPIKTKHDCGEKQ